MQRWEMDATHPSFGGLVRANGSDCRGGLSQGSNACGTAASAASFALCKGGRAAIGWMRAGQGLQMQCSPPCLPD
jgi:hypothetical protein